MAAQTMATQWLERTLDDSAGRRLYLPQAFLGADAIARLLLNVIKGMSINPTVIASHVAEELPFLATENLLMAAVAAGADRQVVHERIRLNSQQVTASIKSGGGRNDLIERLQADPAFVGVNFTAVLKPSQYVGRAPEQTTEFIQDVVEPIRNRYPSLLNQSANVQI